MLDLFIAINILTEALLELKGLRRGAVILRLTHISIVGVVMVSPGRVLILMISGMLAPRRYAGTVHLRHLKLLNH